MKDNFDLEKLKKKKTSRINSGNKGRAFERKICKILNDRFNTKEFNRAPGSGAYATTHAIPDEYKIYGDIITPGNFKFCIECKKGYNGIKISDIFNKKSKLWDFIEQSERDAKKSGRAPLIIFQQDRQNILCIVKSCYGFGYLKEYTVIYPGDDTITNHSTHRGSYVLTKLETYLELNDYYFLG